MKNLNFVAFFTLLSIILAQPLAANDEQLSREKAHSVIDEFVESQLDKEKVNGISLAVIHGQESWFTSGYGYSNVEEDTLASSNSQYRVGAVSGIFTVMLILQLQQAGKLDLDDDIAKYLPQLQFFTHDKQRHQISIRQLLTHHSGLPLSILKDSWSETPADFSQLFDADKPIYLSHAPDTIYSYSNLGYNFLGSLIEKLTEMSYASALQHYIFGPLGMCNTGISLATPAVPANVTPTKLAAGYKKKNKKTQLYPRDLPALGVYSSVSDMAKLVTNLNSSLRDGSGLLSQSQAEQMIAIQNKHIALDLGNRISFGWIIGGMAVQNAGSIVWRGGASLYHRSRVAWLPDKDLAVVVMANDSRSWEATEKIAEKALVIALESIYGIKQNAKDDTQTMKHQGLYGSKDVFADYYNGFLGYIPIERDSEVIKTNILGWKIKAKPENNGWYKLQYNLLGFIPIDISWVADFRIKPARINDQRVLIASYKGTQYLFASHYSYSEPSAAWKNRLGRYEIVNKDSLTDAMEIKDGELLLQNNQLFFRYKLPMFFRLELLVPLKIINDDMAIIPGLGTALNEIVEVTSQGGQEYLNYSGYLLGNKQRKNKTL